SGQVMFIPDTGQGTHGPAAIGKIQLDGSYELTTSVPGDGATIGYHRVAVESYSIEEFNPQQPKLIEPKSLIPALYLDQTTSGLTAEVVAGQQNSIDFELESK